MVWVLKHPPTLKSFSSCSVCNEALEHRRCVCVCVWLCARVCVSERDRNSEGVHASVFISFMKPVLDLRQVLSL